MPCKNICVNLKTVMTVTGSPYLEGEKWCGVCCIFIEWREYIAHAVCGSFVSTLEARKVDAM
jgi:hypothetical protein